MFIICGWDINSEQDISLFVNTYFRFGIVLRNIHAEKITNCAYIVPIRQNEESGVCYKMKAVCIYIYIYGGEIARISTNHVRDGNKNTELFRHEEEK